MSMVGHFMLLVSLASASLQDIVTRSSQDPSSCVQIANPWWCDPTKELTCTPYNYRPFSYNLQHGNICNGEVFDLLTGSRSDARAWAYFDSTGKASSGDFFVFHACDGAGLQSDCKGDIKYVEHFAGRAQGNSCQQDPKTSSNMRNYCKFKHPGLSMKIMRQVGGMTAMPVVKPQMASLTTWLRVQLMGSGGMA